MARKQQQQSSHHRLSWENDQKPSVPPFNGGRKAGQRFISTARVHLQEEPLKIRTHRSLQKRAKIGNVLRTWLKHLQSLHLYANQFTSRETIFICRMILVFLGKSSSNRSLVESALREDYLWLLRFSKLSYFVKPFLRLQ